MLFKNLTIYNFYFTLPFLLTRDKDSENRAKNKINSGKNKKAREKGYKHIFFPLPESGRRATLAVL